MRLGFILLPFLLAGCSQNTDWTVAYTEYYQCVGSLADRFGGLGKASVKQAEESVGQCDKQLERVASMRAIQRTNIPVLRGLSQNEAYKSGFDVFRGLALCRLSDEIDRRDCGIH